MTETDPDADEIKYRSLRLVVDNSAGVRAAGQGDGQDPDDDEGGHGDIDDDASAIEDPPRAPLSARFVVIALVAFQAMAALSDGGKYVTLARAGDEYLVAAILSATASLGLYLGALCLALRPGRGRVLFLVAAAGFGLSLPAWGLSASWSWPMAFGAMLGLAGAWYARAEIRVDEGSEAQP